MVLFRLRHVLLIGLLGIVVYLALNWFSEESRFIRFTREVGLPMESHSASDFVPGPKISKFVSARGYDDPIRYFAESMMLQPSIYRPSDTEISTNMRDDILARGADTLTVYHIDHWLDRETRIIIFHNGDDIMEMTSRTFDATMP